MQEINKAKISMSLVGRQGGEGDQPLPACPEEEWLPEKSRSHPERARDTGSPSQKAALVWSLTGSLFQWYVTVRRSHLESGAMQPSLRDY